MDIHSPASDNIDLLRHVADMNGVATGFWDWYGNWVGVGAPTLLKVLGALGLPLNESSTVGDVEHAMRLTEEREWRRTLPPTIVAREGGGYLFPVHVPDGSWVNVQWVLEDGRKGQCEQIDRYVPPRVIDGQLVGRATFDVPHWVPIGWHRLVATVEGRTCRVRNSHRCAECAEAAHLGVLSPRVGCQRAALFDAFILFLGDRRRG